jgi:hypothetical protein
MKLSGPAFDGWHVGLGLVWQPSEAANPIRKFNEPIADRSVVNLAASAASSLNSNTPFPFPGSRARSVAEKFTELSKLKLSTGEVPL